MFAHPNSAQTGHRAHDDTVGVDHSLPWHAGANGARATPGPSRSASTDMNPAPEPAGQESSSTHMTPPNREARVRISKACIPCRKVKLKCNGETPCGRCSAINPSIDNQCVYPPSMRGKTRRKKSEIEADRGVGVDGGDNPQSALMTESERSWQKRPRFSGGDDSRGQDPRQWDEGWTMRSMKEDFEKWKDYEDLTVNGPRNHNLWNNGEDSPDHPHAARNAHAGPSIASNVRPYITQARSSLDHNIVPDRYTTLPYPGDAHNPLGVLAEASATAGNAEEGITSPSPFQPTGGPGDRPGSEDGEGSNGYYVPLERVLKKDAPHIMSLISISEAEQLFNTYFELLHPHLPFLDREHSTPAALAQRNNFLFNAICCVAARATDPVRWDRLKEFARFEMDRFPKDKNIDVVQGHLIYSVWNITGPKTFEQDKSWLRVGIAIRTGIDINLHRVALSKSARQGLPNWLLRMIIRTWLLTYVIDRNLSAQLGKPTTLRGEHSFQLYSDLISREEGMKTVDDAWVASLAEWTQVLGRVHDVFGSDSSDYPTSRSVSSQFPDLVHVFQKQFHHLCESSLANARTFDHLDNGRGARCMVANVTLYNRYARLIVNSFGLQRALDSRKADLPSAFAEYQASAIRLIDEFESDFESSGLARGCPDFIFTFLTFGAVSLLKGVQPQYAHLEPDRHYLIALARKSAGILSRSAATPDHLPAIQHTFLSRLIDSRSKPAAVAKSGIAMMDFEAFGQSIDADLSKTPWPPTGPSAVTHTQNITRPQTPTMAQTVQSTAPEVPNGSAQHIEPLAGVNMDMLEPDFGWGSMRVGMGLDEGSHGGHDGFGWLSGIGAGGGFFGNEGDMAFAQDPFWRTLLETVPGPQ